MMASLQCCAPASHSIGALHRPYYAGVHAPSLTARYNLQSCLHFRFKNEVRLQVKRKRSTVFASNTNPPEGSDEAKANDDTAQGPPFLTILAGLVVFLVIFWIIGSIVTWLIGLIVHPPPFK